MAKTSSTKKTTRSMVTGSKTPAQGALWVVTVEDQVSPLSVAAEKNMMTCSAQHVHLAKTKSAEEQWACKATEASAKAAKATVKTVVKI